MDNLLTKYETENNIEPGTIKIAATIETALGVYNAYEIATASPRMFAIGLGAEDFRADMRMVRSEDAEEILFARNQISLCAHAAKVIPMDYVNSNFQDPEGFKKDVAFGKSLDIHVNLVSTPIKSHWYTKSILLRTKKLPMQKG